MATLTAAGYNAQPRVRADGALVAQKWVFQAAGTSVSASDVILLGRLANGSVIVDGWVKGKPGSDGSCTWKVGITGNDVFFTPAAVSITTSGNQSLRGLATGYPKAISLSADAEGLLYTNLTLTKSTGTSTVTGSVEVTLLIQHPTV